MSAGIPISALPAETAVDGNTLIAIVAVGEIIGITQATTAVVTINAATASNPFAAGDQAYINNVGGMTQINGLGAPPNGVLTVSAVGGVSGAWTVSVPVNSSGFSAYTSGGTITATKVATLAALLLAAGTYESPFTSGSIQVKGSDGLLAGYGNFQVGFALPNASGTPSEGILIGGAGAVQVVHITDEQLPGQKGITVITEAGDASATTPATDDGGDLLDFAGGSVNGTGGQRKVQGGTSANKAAGITIVAGGNASGSTADAVPGDVFSIGGQVGMQGATNHWIASVLNGIAGFLRHRFNSTIIIDEVVDGSWFFYAVDGGTFGAVGAPLISRGTGQPMGPAIPGTDVIAAHTVPLAKLTSGGAAGSMTITNGLITAITDPT